MKESIAHLLAYLNNRDLDLPASAWSHTLMSPLISLCLSLLRDMGRHSYILVGFFFLVTHASGMKGSNFPFIHVSVNICINFSVDLLSRSV